MKVIIPTKLYFSVTFLILFLITSCSSLNFFEDNKFYYKNGFQRVQLHSENKSVRNIHPVKIDPLRLEGALKLIITKYGPKAESLFQEDKLLPYSISISEALLEAKPNQDVVFTVEGWFKKKALSDNRVTSGRIFYNKNGLNIIFGSVMRKGNMSETDPMLSHGINPDLDKNPYAPGSRFQSIKSAYMLTTIPNSGVFRPKEARGRVDWLVFSPSALTARNALSLDQKRLSSAANFQVQGLRDELNVLKRELRNLRGTGYPNYYNNNPNYVYRPPNGYVQQQMRANNYPNYPYPPQNYQMPQNYQAPRNDPNKQISLKSLESMRERGLISEETYVDKLKELGF